MKIPAIWGVFVPQLDLDFVLAIWAWLLWVWKGRIAPSHPEFLQHLPGIVEGGNNQMEMGIPPWLRGSVRSTNTTGGWWGWRGLMSHFSAGQRWVKARWLLLSSLLLLKSLDTQNRKAPAGTQGCLRDGDLQDLAPP